MLSITTDIMRGLAISETLQAIAQAGYEAVEFGRVHDKALLEAGGDVLAEAAHIGDQARALGVPALQMHAPQVNPCSADEPNAMAALESAIERAGAMGVAWLVVHPGHDVRAGSSRLIDVRVREDNLRLFERLLPIAERLGVGLAVENMTTYSGKPGYPKMDIRFGQSAADLLWLMEEIVHPGFGICWDTGHANTQKIDQPLALLEIGQHLKALHLHDNDGTADAHWAPLRGTVDWGSVYTALNQINYRGPFNFELSGERRAPVNLRVHVLNLVSGIHHHLRAR